MKKPTINYKAASPNGNRCEIRESTSPYETGFSVFTWNDNWTDRGVIQWRESHELPWDTAFIIATTWIDSK